jgi:hypothetical protein
MINVNSPAGVMVTQVSGLTSITCTDVTTDKTIVFKYKHSDTATLSTN